MEGQTGATHIHPTQGETQTQTQKETGTDSVEPPDSQKLLYQRHSAHGNMRTHQSR